MFNKKLRQRVESMGREVGSNYTFHRDEYWKLSRQIDDLKSELATLVASLGLSRQETHKVEYVKKGGPEQP